MTSSFTASQASCRVSFPPCCSRVEVARINLTLISPICAWKGKVYIVTPPNLKLDYIVKKKEKEFVRKSNAYKLLICISANHILFVLDILFFLSRVKINSTNWSAPNVWVFVAQLVELLSPNAKAMGSTPVKAPKFFRVYLQLL